MSVPNDKDDPPSLGGEQTDSLLPSDAVEVYSDDDDPEFQRALQEQTEVFEAEQKLADV